MRRVFFWLIVFGLLSVRVSWASGFNLKSIGSVDTSGRQISHWWYTSSSPTFIGEAPAGSTVTITIDGQETSVTADTNNDWSYTSGSLIGEDHSILLTNNGSTINFTLTIGSENVDWDAVNADAETTTLPTVGIILPTVLLSSAGVGLIFGAKKLVKKN
jgi:hypothetical protein